MKVRDKNFSPAEMFGGVTAFDTQKSYELTKEAQKFVEIMYESKKMN